MCNLYISHREDLGKYLERSLSPPMPLLALEIAALREWSLSICHGGAEAFGEGHVTKMQF